MTTLKAAVEDGEWGDKPFLVTLGGSRVVTVDTREQADDIAGRLDRIITARVEAALEAVFADYPDQTPFKHAVDVALLGEEPAEPAPDTRTDAEKRQDVYILLEPRARAVLLYCAAGKLAPAGLLGGTVVARLRGLGLYGGSSLGSELTPWGYEIAGGIARSMPKVWAEIQAGTFVPEGKFLT